MYGRRVGNVQVAWGLDEIMQQRSDKREGLSLGPWKTRQPGPYEIRTKPRENAGKYAGMEGDTDTCWN